MLFAKPRLSLSPALNQLDNGGMEAYFHWRDITEGRLPHHLWHSVIHEFTHHWEFLGPVGAALNLLYVNQVKQVSEGVEQEWPIERIVNQAQTVFFLHDVAVSCLEPMAEALALYAEHDLGPADNDLECEVLAWARILFTDIENLQGPRRIEISDERLKRFLLEARLSVSGIDRKADLLTSSLHESDEATAEDDYHGYLPAYMLLCGTQRARIRADVRMSNGNYIMLLVKTLFFDDFALVDAVLDALDPSINRYYAAARITQIVSHRQRELLAGDLGQMFDEIENNSGKGGSGSPLTSGLPSELEDGGDLNLLWRRGKRRLQEGIDAIWSSTDRVGEVGRSSLAQREVFPLFRASYPCTTRGGIVVPQAKMPLSEYVVSPASVNDLPDNGGEIDALFEVCILPARAQIVATQYLGKTPVHSAAVRSIPLWNNAGFQFDPLGRLRGIESQQLLSKTWKSLDRLIAGTEDGAAHKRVADEVAHQFHRDNVTLPAFRIFTSGRHGLATMDDMLDIDSFLETVSPDMLRKLAAVSLIARFNFPEDMSQQLFHEVGVQYHEQWDLKSVATREASGVGGLLLRRVATISDSILMPPWM